MIKLLKTLGFVQLIYWTGHALVWLTASFYYVDWQEFMPLIDPEQRHVRMAMIVCFFSTNAMTYIILDFNGYYNKGVPS